MSELPELPEFPRSIELLCVEPEDGPAVHAYAREYALLAVKAERERCALIAEGFIDPEWPNDAVSLQCQDIADAIRSTSESPSP